MVLPKKNLEDIELSLKSYPDLRLTNNENEISIDGLWPVEQDGIVIQTYSILIQISKNYPVELPKVYETSGKIPRKIDRHINSSLGDACLFVEDERWEIWPLNTSFKVFLEVPVHNFFLYQAYFELMGHYPHGERNHGIKGKIEYYFEKLNVNSEKVVLKLLESASKPLSHREQCPCGNKKKFKYCHLPALTKIRANSNSQVLENTLNELKQRRILRNRQVFEQRQTKHQVLFDSNPDEI